MSPAEFARRANIELRARVRRFEDVAELDAEQLMTWFETAGLPDADETDDETDAQWSARIERMNREGKDECAAEDAWYRERGL